MTAPTLAEALAIVEESAPIINLKKGVVGQVILAAARSLLDGEEVDWCVVHRAPADDHTGDCLVVRRILVTPLRGNR